MKRLLVLLALFALLFGLHHAPSVTAAPDSDKAAAMDALKEFNDYIGEYTAGGAPPPPKKDPKGEWSETINWGWKFKAGDAWMVMDVKKGKFLKSGELKYDPAKKVYLFAAQDITGKKLDFEGNLTKEGWLLLERTDKKTKEVQHIRMSSNNDGARFIYEAEHKPDGRKLFIKDYQVAGSKVGESIGSKEKKPECVVSGGIGTMQVAFGGKNYFVCCGGCRDAFNENPAKYVKEFEAKHKK